MLNSHSEQKVYNEQITHNEAGYLYTFKPLYAVAVFSADNWPDKDYPLESRSYKFSCDNKAFHSYCGGYSCFASSLDGSDPRVDLTKYDWKVDYCYLL